VLRAHGGPGGLAVGTNLATARPVDGWSVTMTAAGVSCVGYLGAEEPIRFSAPHEDGLLAEAPQEFIDLLNEESPSEIQLTTEDGRTVSVCGRDGMSAAMAMDLVAMVNGRRLPVSRDGCVVEVVVDDLALGSFLLEVHGEHPDVIAEALRVLQRLNPRGERRLRQVLWGRRELRPLAEAVERELTGVG